MKTQNTLAELVKAQALLRQMRGKIPETSRYSDKIQEVEHILDEAIIDIKANKNGIDRKKLLEVTQLLRFIFEMLGCIKDLFISCCQQTFGYLNANRCSEATNW